MVLRVDDLVAHAALRRGRKLDQHDRRAERVRDGVSRAVFQMERGEGREGGEKGESGLEMRAGHFSAQLKCEGGSLVGAVVELPHQSSELPHQSTTVLPTITCSSLLALPPSSVTLLPSPCLARPIDPSKPTSPWLILEERGTKSRPLSAGRIDDNLQPAMTSDYSAHLGANSGGANGVYWVELLGKPPMACGFATWPPRERIASSRWNG